MYALTTAKISSRHLEPIMQQYPDLLIEHVNSEEILSRISEAEIIISYGEDLTSEIISEAINLKWLMVMSAGIDKLPLNQLMKQEILVTNARGIHKNPMAEHAFALMLQDSRRLIPLLDFQRAKDWDRSIRVRELTGLNLVIVGAGAIGQEVARKAKAFDMNTFGISYSGKGLANIDKMYKADGLWEVLPQADYIVLITPLTPQTRDMFGEREFKGMKKDCFFINIARGEVVQEDALVKALKEGWIRGAAIDTFREEPLPKNSPLWDLPNLVITPHLAGLTPHYMERAVEIFKHNLEIYTSGKGTMKNIVDLRKGY
ncbi:MAG: D-2-hydroxyacid dehydrogenase [Bacillota bacterium]